MAALVSFPYVYNLSKRELYEKVIRDVMEGKAGNIHSDVYQAYSDNLRKAVGGVFPQGNPGDPYFDLEAQLQANVTRFAAYKAWHLTEQLKKQREKWTDDDEYKKVAKAVLNTFNRYQAAEYNTATARARTAKQWTDFNADPIANELYPNLRWLPSRSASPREEHIVFYNRVWAKTDPFWSVNQPGNLWNCKCDWEETDDPVTEGNPTGAHHARGLEGNPAETGEIFGENCTYFKQVSNTKSKKLEHYAGDKFLRKESANNVHAFQGKPPIKIDKRGEEIEVIVDSKTTGHISNDIAQSANFLWNELSSNIEEVLKNGNLVAHEPNAKQDKKIWAVEYYYYECKIAGNTFYLSIEENNNTIEKRHFYRLYSITKNLRSSAIFY